MASDPSCHDRTKSVTVHSLALRSEREAEIDLTVTTSTGFYVRSLAHDIGRMLDCGGYLHHLCRQAIGPYKVEDALPQEALENARDPAEIIESKAWIPLDRIMLPLPELTINAAAADRFVHGQEVVVFKTGTESIETDEHVVIRASSGSLVGIGIVKAVLARGRTINVHPTMVLAEAKNLGGRR